MESAEWGDQLLKALEHPRVLYTVDLAWTPSRSIEAHSHDSFYQLDFFYGGYGKVSARKKVYSVTPGDVFVANPNDEHEFHAAPHLPLQGITYKFALRDFKDEKLPVMPNYLGNLAVLPGPRQRELHDLLRRGSAEYNHQRRGHQQASSMLLGLFFVLLLRYFEERRSLSPEEAGRGVSKAVQEYIQRCYHLPLTLADLGRLAGLHPRYLCQRFSSETGKSPMAALTHARIEAAKKLLATSHLPVSRIGTQVGYPDVFHFSKRFKQLAGKSPKQYRAEAQKD